MTVAPPMPTFDGTPTSHYLITGIHAALGADGEGFFVATEQFSGRYGKSAERFPFTEEGWTQVWGTFHELDARAAERYAVKAASTETGATSSPVRVAGTLRQTEDGSWWVSNEDGSWKPSERQLTQAPDGKWWAKQEDGSLAAVDAPAVLRHGGTPRPAPGTGIVWVVSLLFGVFGLIPAAIQANAARQEGHDTGPYWAAFWIPMIIGTVLWILVFVAVANSAGSSGSDCFSYGTC